MIGVRGITRFTSRMATTMMRPLSSSSSSSAILFHDVTAANADGLVANKISFKLEKGDRVALTGPNQEGRDAIMNMLKGELQPAGGHINFLQGKNVVTFSPTVGKKDHALSVSEFLAQHSVSPEAVKEALKNVSLGDLRLARTLSTLTASNIFRLKLISLQFQKPDVLLVDFPLDDLSYDDTQLLTAFLKLNSMKSTVVLNLNDEYFIQSIVNNVIDVESLDVPTTQSQDDYASVKTKKQQKRKQVEEATAAAVREEIKRRAQHDADPATIEALNAIGFQNTSQAVSQEEYIRVMVICMILHPPIAAALYFGGFLDAIL